MASLADKVALAADTKFVNRIKAAVVETAFAVLAEDPATVPGWPARGALAARALGDLNATAPLFVMAAAIADSLVDVYAVGAKNSDLIPDAAIRDRVASVWNNLAGR